MTPWTVAYQFLLFTEFSRQEWLKWIASPFSRGFSQLKGWTQVSCIAGGLFTVRATREAQQLLYNLAVPRETKMLVHAKTHLIILIAAIPIIVKIWRKLKCAHPCEWIKKCTLTKWNITFHKRNKWMTDNAKTWMNYSSIMLLKQHLKCISYDSFYMSFSWMQTCSDRNTNWVVSCQVFWAERSTECKEVGGDCSLYCQYWWSHNSSICSLKDGDFYLCK